jgi:hypothetical protein
MGRKFQAMELSTSSKGCPNRRATKDWGQRSGPQRTDKALQETWKGGANCPLWRYLDKWGFLNHPNPLAWARTVQARIDCISKRNQMTIKIPYTSIQKMAEICALIDSRAIENFLDEQVVKQLGVGRKPLLWPRKVSNVDGTENKGGMLTHYCELCVCMGEQEGIEKFFITNLGEDQAILGLVL